MVQKSKEKTGAERIIIISSTDPMNWYHKVIGMEFHIWETEDPGYYFAGFSFSDKIRFPILKSDCIVSVRKGKRVNTEIIKSYQEHEKRAYYRKDQERYSQREKI